MTQPYRLLLATALAAFLACPPLAAQPEPPTDSLSDLPSAPPVAWRVMLYLVGDDDPRPAPLPVLPPLPDLAPLPGSAPLPAPAPAPVSVSAEAPETEEAQAPIEVPQLATLERIAAQPFNPHVRYVAQLDRSPWRTEELRAGPLGSEDAGATRLVLEESGWVEVANLGEVNSANPATLTGFLDWAAQTHPAYQTMLWLDGHGSGVNPAGEVTLTQMVGGMVDQGLPRPAQLTKAPKGDPSLPGLYGLGLTPVENSEAKAPRTAPRSFGFDSTDGSYMDFRLIRDALAGHRGNRGHPIDVVFFYACLAGSLEGAYELRDEARFLLASGDEMLYGDGLSPVASALAKDPDLDPPGLVRAATQAFEKQLGQALASENLSKESGDMLIGWDLSRIRPVARNVARLGGVLQSILPGLDPELAKLMWRSLLPGLWPHYYDGSRQYIDVAFWARSMSIVGRFVGGRRAGNTIQAAAKRVLQSLEAARVAEGRAGLWAGRPEHVGLSLYFPVFPTSASARANYQRLEFAQKGRWQDVLSTVRGQVTAAFPDEDWFGRGAFPVDVSTGESESD